MEPGLYSPMSSMILAKFPGAVGGDLIPVIAS